MGQSVCVTLAIGSGASVGLNLDAIEAQHGVDTFHSHVNGDWEKGV